MKILFIYSLQDSQSLNKPLQDATQIQFGISYISSFLKQYRHDTKLLVLSRETRIKEIDKFVEAYSPRLICFTAVYTEYKFITDMAKYIKTRYPKIFLLAGGVHVSLNPDECIFDSFDALCIGEGEFPTLELVNQLENNQEPTGIPNLWIKHGDNVERNSNRSFLQDLDSLPFPDRQLWQEWIMEPGEYHSILLGRGCPFQCTYCCNHSLKNLARGNYVRFRSADNILDEIKEIITKYPATKEIYLEIETIVANKSFAIDLSSKLEHFNSTLVKPISFGTNVRIAPNIDIENVIAAFRNSNFRFINIGIESGSERVRRQILKRYYSNDDIFRVVNTARRHGLQICFYNLIGIPGETQEDFYETVRINRECLPDWHFLSIFFPYPGTQLYRLSKELGLIKDPLDTRMERSRAILDLPGFSKKQIQKSYIWFDYYVYRGHKPLFKILARVIASKIKTDYRLNNIYRKLTGYGFFRYIKNRLKRY